MPDPTTGATPQNVQTQQALNNELTETRNLANEIRNDFRGIGAELSDAIARGMENLNGSARNVAETIRKDLNRSIEKQKVYTNDIKNLEGNRRNESLKLSKIEALISKTKQQQLNIEDYLLEAVAEGLITEEERKEKLEDINKRYKEQQGILKTLAKEAEKLEKSLGLTYRIFDGISKVPILGTLMNVSKVKKKMEEAAEDGKKAWSVFGVGISETFKQIGKSLTDPLVIITGIVSAISFLIKLVLEADKRMTDFAKNLSISKETSKSLSLNFSLIQAQAKEFNKNLEESFFNSVNQVEAVNQLNAALGTAGMFTSKQRADQIVLTKQMGLEVETAVKLQQLAGLQRKDTEKITNEIGDQVVKFRQETGIALNFRKVMTDVTKVSGVLSANLGNDPKRIAAAIIQAQKLGVTLEQSRKISEGLLNFESSIESELEAELLTGKRLNFERARALALQGKTTEAATELLEQVGGLDEFQKLNIIQQNSIAKSINMTSDELADAYKQQELLKGTAFSTKEAFEEQAKIAEKQGRLDEFIAGVRGAANGEQLAAMASQIGIQERFNQTMETLKIILSDIVAGPIGKMLEDLSKFLSKGENIKKIFEGVNTVVSGIATIMKALILYIGAQGIATLFRFGAAFIPALMRSGILLVEAIGIASALTLGIAAFAIGSAVMSAMSSINSVKNQFKTVEDGIATPDRGPFTITDRFGATAVTTAGDGLAVSPNMSVGGGITKDDLKEAMQSAQFNIQFTAGSDTILKLNTAQSQYSSPSVFA